MTRRLDDLLAQARRDFGDEAARRVDWSAVDRGLFERIEAEGAGQQAPVRGPGRLAVGMAAALAAAAVVVVVAGKAHPPAQRSDARAVASRAEPAAQITSAGGDGTALLDGAAVHPGAPVRLGDTVEASSGEVTIVREGKVTMELEPGARVVLRRAGEPLVFALERGALRAQVTPVPAGEAFAVDVGGARVAVHGTVLRVARALDRASVDLAEGVVSIGDAPRLGPVVGSLVTAPAHAEFTVTDAVRTLTITHDPASLRPVPAEGRSAPPSAAPEETERAPRARVEPASARVRPSLPKNEARGPNASGAAASTSPTAPGAADALEQKVLSCMADTPHAENVTVRINTTLTIEVGDDGAVRTARFDPPVSPEVNECASPAIYKARFARAGAVAIPIQFEN